MQKCILFFLILCIIAGPISSEEISDDVSRCEKKYRDAAELYESENYRRAAPIFDDLIRNCVTEIEERDSLHLRAGNTKFALENYSEAAIEYEEILARYPQTPIAQEALYLLALSRYKDAPIVERDISILRRAQQRFNRYVHTYPESPRADSAQMYLDSIYEKFVSKDLNTAQFYSIINEYNSAVIYCEHILQEYPKTQRADTITAMLAENLIRAQRIPEAQTYIERLSENNYSSKEIDRLKQLISSE
jgi:outer membrane protein assembly factor BamD